MTDVAAQILTEPWVGRRLEDGGLAVEIFAAAKLPTAHGDFRIVVFRNSLDDKEHLAIVRGEVQDAADVWVRLHSECLTGDVLGSLRCDCRAQLEQALQTIGERDNGVVLYLRQEGRGIGLGNKIRAYALQEEGLNTFEANEHLGFDADLRDYRVAALMLRLLGIASVRLLTNNPRKMFGLSGNGVVVTGRLPLITVSNPHNAQYLATKAEHGHWLDRLRDSFGQGA